METDRAVQGKTASKLLHVTWVGQSLPTFPQMAMLIVILTIVSALAALPTCRTSPGHRDDGRR